MWYIVTNGADIIVIACLTMSLLLLWVTWSWSFETLRALRCCHDNVVVMVYHVILGIWSVRVVPDLCVC